MRALISDATMLEWVLAAEVVERYGIGAGTDEIIAAQQASGRLVTVISQHRFDPATAEPSRVAEAVEQRIAEVRSAHPVRGEKFDVKHSPGGMMDVEFAVQYLVLAHSAAQGLEGLVFGAPAGVHAEVCF